MVDREMWQPETRFSGSLACASPCSYAGRASFLYYEVEAWAIALPLVAPLLWHPGAMAVAPMSLSVSRRFETGDGLGK